MDDKTSVFINASKSMLERALKNGSDQTWINYLRDYSAGKCPCGKTLEVVSFQKTGSGAKWSFKCGHTYNAISLEETVNLKEGYSAHSVGKLGQDGQKIRSKIGGAQITKEDREIAVVKQLCNNFKPDLKKFRSDVLDSPVDVIAGGNGKIENFQVTKLYDENFWRELYTKKEINTVIPVISSLVEKAIKRKNLFDQGSKNNIVLVIDTWPGVLPDLALKASKLEIVNKSGFREIWLAGLTAEMTYKIFPTKIGINGDLDK